MNRQIASLILGLACSASILAQNQPLSIFTSALPAATIGQPYLAALTANGGTAPYLWSLAGALPQTFSLNTNTGVLSGTPGTTGSFPLTIRVIDAAGATVTQGFTLTVNPPALVITSENPLFGGTLGAFYSQNLRATGGVPPYKWTLTAGQLPSGLTLDPQAGAIGGTPTAMGVSTFTIQVGDATSATVEKTFSINIQTPPLVITAPSTLPDAIAGSSYTFRMSAAGGKAPYTWSVSSAVSGLLLDPTTGVLSGIPGMAGTFSITIQVKDAAAAVATKTISLTVKPGQLAMAITDQLPVATIGVPFSFSFSASGGTPPYRWSANGLPDGFTLDAQTGLLTGSPSSPGTATFTIRVADAAVSSATALFHLSTAAPELPQVTITGPAASSDPAQQAAVGVNIDSAYPAPLTGQLTLTFAPDSGLGDSTVQFSTGGRTVPFSIPAGLTSAQFPSRLAIQTGTVAGTITLAAQFQVGQVDITPLAPPSISTHINKSAPVVSSAKLVRNSSGFAIEITGYSTTLEIAKAVFRFKAAGSATLGNSQVELSVSDLFTKWFQDPASSRFGSQFTFTQSFTIQGDPNAVLPDSITLSNRVGDTIAVIQ